MAASRISTGVSFHNFIAECLKPFLHVPYLVIGIMKIMAIYDPKGKCLKGRNFTKFLGGRCQRLPCEYFLSVSFFGKIT